jgi:hypothetical protein
VVRSTCSSILKGLSGSLSTKPLSETIFSFRFPLPG